MKTAAAVGALIWLCAQTQASPQSSEVVPPVSANGTEAQFPPGAGSDIANAQCLICHSADMVLYQPPRTQSEWVATINKMRTAYGAPMPADEVDALSVYLSKLSATLKGS